MSNQYRLLIKKSSDPSLVFPQCYDGEQRLDVKDLNTRVNINVRVYELSPYRHILLLEGMEYQIVNITRELVNEGQSKAQQEVMR